MNSKITQMVDGFESGRLSRRDLILGLTMLVASQRAAAQAAVTAPPSLPSRGIDHICVRVRDLDRSTQFYQSVFGLSVLGEDEAHRIRRLGGDHVTVSLRQDEPYGTIDHFCMKLESFDKQAVTQRLAAHGLTPKEDWEYGFYVRDPDDAVVQML